MGLIPIGISEGVNLSKETGIVDDKMYIVMEISPSEEEVLQGIITGKVIQPAKSSFLQFLPSMKKYNSEDTKDYMTLLGEFQRFGNMLERYAILVTSEELVENKLKTDKAFLLMGIPVDKILASLPSLTKDDFIKRAFHAQFQIFTDFLTSVDGLEKFKFRHKYWRGSKKKTFSGIPRESGMPFVEPMSIALEDSAIKWSVDELETGKNNTTEVEADAPDNSAAQTAAAMFSTEESVPEGLSNPAPSIM